MGSSPAPPTRTIIIVCNNPDSLSEPGDGYFQHSVSLSFPINTDSIARIIGTGIDIVASERVRRMLEVHGERFLERCFTQSEREFCMSRKDSVQNLAVRLAAKEACFKAIGGRRGMGLGWREFEVVLEEGIIPAIRLHRAAEKRAEFLKIRKVWLSLTHEDEWSAAVVIMTS